MTVSYIDKYYNHFSKSRRSGIKPLTTGKNYLMRFNTKLPYSFSKNQNALTIVYSNSQNPLLLNSSSHSTKLHTNNFAIIRPETDWEFISDESKRVDILSFMLSHDFLKKFSNMNSFLNLDNSESIECNSINFIENIYNANYHETGKFLQNFFKISNTTSLAHIDPEEISFELLNCLFNEHTNYLTKIKEIKGKKSSTQKEIFKRVLIARNYIHDCIENEVITILDLSLASGLSEYHIYDSFKAIFKTTPHQYINSIRIERAKNYLKTTNLSIIEIAQILHFPDLPSFSKLFKLKEGVPPSKYIKDFREI
ncbi:helix-turn-helix domain-containing protein [Aquimarina sp. 2-A2]|uniref:helix-turn-helix domain-containing protein n=1 Tax=Aquimarina sp. 2-A2 TaxID=3382644 RepID=UPI00387F3311